MKITKVSFSLAALADYQYWQKQDRKTLKAINKIIDDMIRHPFTGIGKPEPLKFQLDNCWSRRINKADRIVYMVSADTIWIIQCRYHY
ncbi:Txe/YoeB family addiction module toxin [Levilactobacillus namurensis]|uniref:Txe/YoeB family addiction module toxin n=1 Tax=Levilactobacillus namurensis TaxID=380393 RepID=UPI00222E4A19|nr:Txe/YoeB family addiction module toxin [Levilactobacillus namurensis]MCW3778822.1 Txe/YoeB family addiction module toxin [Levilactobacillus namurensis]MDT7019396.1 Txe/YoeB family addiction module toxin [Levilactobacillus namurensis]WNN66008.1 Txe/YoeB family addiction module toxin [Levilactobacillus namurensis]